MTRQRSSLAAGLALLLCACPRAGAEAPAPQPRAYRGVVVWLRPSPDTTTVAFTPEWRRVLSGADSVWAFAGARAGGWRAYGRIEGDSLAWGLASISGDAGNAFEFAGVPEPDGTVRGCLRAPRRGWTPSASAAAFILRPAGAPAPSASDAPVERCG